jgi:hypothetical protein
MGQAPSLIYENTNSILVDGLALIDSAFSVVKFWGDTPQGFCRMSERFSEILPRKHDSASLSQVVFGKKDHEDIAMKLFFNPRSDDNGLIIEGEIYEKIIQKLLKRKVTPHVLGFYAFAKCDDKIFNDLSNIVQNSYESKLQSGIDRLKKQSLRINGTLEGGVYALVIQKAVNCMPLEDWLMYPHSHEETVAVFFQILYTLEAFNRYGLRQNDMHFKNIMVQETKQNEINEYIVDGVKFYVSTRWNVFIFDFDRGSVSPTLANNNTEMKNTGLTVGENICRTIGSCNGVNPKYDTFKFLCVWRSTKVGKKLLWSEFISWATNIEPDNMFCFLPQSKKRGASVEYIPPDGLDEERSSKLRKGTDQSNSYEKSTFMRPTIELLNHDIFSIFSNTPKPVQNTFSLPPV